jgi:replication-associated recombination protein RarA
MKCEIKYAPTNLDEVIYPSVAVEHRIKGYARGQLEGHVMLHGPNGTGKTTVAKLLVQAIGGDAAMQEPLGYEELLAKQDLRDYLFNSAALAKLTVSRKHFLLLNEFDNAKKGVNKLWTALDDCGEGVMAIITTNEPMDIHKSVRSRCDVIEMPGITAMAVLRRVQYALQAEGLHLPDQQVLHYLKSQERLLDLRKYFKMADELLYLQSNGLPFPAWSGTPTAFKVV